MAALLTTLGISIHAPREGGDGGLGFFLYHDELISIHAPREGGDIIIWSPTFLDSYFNPRPPRGGRPGYQYEDLRLVVISIHAPREGGDHTPIK